VSDPAAEQSNEHGTRLLRAFVLVDLAASECGTLADSGYDPAMEKYSLALQKMAESLARRLSAERAKHDPPEEPPGFIVPFKGRG